MFCLQSGITPKRGSTKCIIIRWRADLKGSVLCKSWHNVRGRDTSRNQYSKTRPDYSFSLTTKEQTYLPKKRTSSKGVQRLTNRTPAPFSSILNEFTLLTQHGSGTMNCRVHRAWGVLSLLSDPSDDWPAPHLKETHRQHDIYAQVATNHVVTWREHMGDGKTLCTCRERNTPEHYCSLALSVHFKRSDDSLIDEKKRNNITSNRFIGL